MTIEKVNKQQNMRTIIKIKVSYNVKIYSFIV